jgi:hypothetical protein
MADEQLAAPLRLESQRQRKTSASMTVPERGLFTIAEVTQACGLPQPVVAQLVPRVWTSAGWMYTGDQLAYAVHIALKVRAGEYVAPAQH